MRERDIPLYSLETKQAVRDFDLLGISLPYEQLYTNALNLLDLAGMPVLSRDRDERYPLVIAGGHACYNPEPMADFIDAFVIGEGEEIILSCSDDPGECAASRDTSSFVRSPNPGNVCAALLRCRVPRRWHGARCHAQRTHIPARVPSVLVVTLPKPFTKFIVPNIDTVHNRGADRDHAPVAREVAASAMPAMVTRPVRERPVDEIMAAIGEIVQYTGFEEISLLSLSSSDYVWVEELAEEVNRVYKDAGLSLSLPSLRIESASADLLEKIGGTRRSGFTFAPESGPPKRCAI